MTDANREKQGSGSVFLFYANANTLQVSFVLPPWRGCRIECGMTRLGIISSFMVKMTCAEILEKLTDTYLQYRELVTPAQWNFLVAVAKEGEVEKITSTHFLSTYNIGGATSAKRMAQSLSDKELLLSIAKTKKTTYQIYDVFFSRWIETYL